MYSFTLRQNPSIEIIKQLSARNQTSKVCLFGRIIVQSAHLWSLLVKKVYDDDYVV